MAALRVIKLSLKDLHLEELSGCGNSITLKAIAFRTTKAGTPELYELQLDICRYGIKQFLARVKEMHVRDRERIASEQLRIQQEINALKVDQ